MKILIADNYKRVRIPDAKPHQVFAYDNNGHGTLTLTEVRKVKPSAALAGAVRPFTKEEVKRAFAPDPEWDAIAADMALAR